MSDALYAIHTTAAILFLVVLIGDTATYVPHVDPPMLYLSYGLRFLAIGLVAYSIYMVFRGPKSRS